MNHVLFKVKLDVCDLQGRMNNAGAAEAAALRRPVERIMYSSSHVSAPQGVVQHGCSSCVWMYVCSSEVCWSPVGAATRCTPDTLTVRLCLCV